MLLHKSTKITNVSVVYKIKPDNKQMDFIELFIYKEAWRKFDLLKSKTDGEC